MVDYYVEIIKLLCLITKNALQKLDLFKKSQIILTCIRMSADEIFASSIGVTINRFRYPSREHSTLININTVPRIIIIHEPISTVQMWAVPFWNACDVIRSHSDETCLADACTITVTFRKNRWTDIPSGSIFEGISTRIKAICRRMTDLITVLSMKNC